MNSERERAILEILLQQKKVTVKELADRLYISEPSIRRDLAELEKRHLLKRVYGGAILLDNDITKQKIPFLVREMEQSNAKVIIAKKASALVNEGSVIFLDASSSAYNMIPFLAAKKDLLIITNGLKTQMKLAEYNMRTISTGGQLLNNCFALVGEEAYKTIERFNADFFFFSCRGLSENGDLTDISDSENYVRNKMMEHSNASYLLCNSNKIDTKYFHHLCHASQLTGIISNECNPPQKIKPYFVP